MNGYGLFRVMTKDRREIVIEGSADGIDWLPYEFKWKPGDVMRAPGWCAPHQPRLDWQMWFAALGNYRQNPWFGRLIVRLLENKRDVTGLFERNPFPDSPPRYVRARFLSLPFHDGGGTSANRRVVETPGVGRIPAVNFSRTSPVRSTMEPAQRWIGL